MSYLHRICKILRTAVPTNPHTTLLPPQQPVKGIVNLAYACVFVFIHTYIRYRAKSSFNHNCCYRNLHPFPRNYHTGLTTPLHMHKSNKCWWWWWWYHPTYSTIFSLSYTMQSHLEIQFGVADYSVWMKVRTWHMSQECRYCREFF